MAARRSSVSVRGEIGDTGTVITGGIISDDEYNRELSGSTRLRTVEKMRRGDATVRASLLAVKLPIISAHWFIQPVSEEESDVTIARFIEEQLLEGMTRTWQDFLREALNFLDFGHYLFEIVYQDDVFEGKPVYGLRKLAPRLPSTVMRWQTKDGKDGITQLTITKGEVSIPMEKLVIFVNEKEGDNWEGQTILRSAYKHWYIKDSLYKIDAIAHERQGLGIPYVKRKVNAGKKDKEKAREIIENIRANQKGYLEIPEGWDIGFIDMKAKATRDPENSLKHHDRAILLNVMAQFLALGSTETGSYALSADQSDLFILSLQSVAKHIRDAVQKYVIEKLVDLNFDVEEYPQLEFEKIGSVDVNALSTAIQRVTQSGMLTNTLETEKYLRNVFGLPELSDEDIEEREEQIEEKKRLRDSFLREKEENGGNNKPKAQDRKGIGRKFSGALDDFRSNILHIIENAKP